MNPTGEPRHAHRLAAIDQAALDGIEHDVGLGAGATLRCRAVAGYERRNRVQSRSSLLDNETVRGVGYRFVEEPDA